MQLKLYRLTLIGLIASATLASCSDPDQTTSKTISNSSSSKDSVKIVGNTTSTISTEINLLIKLLDFSVYKPTSVKFKYSVIDNSGQNQRLSTPGPSDWTLQALLCFDSLTFSKITTITKNTDYQDPNYNKQEFRFDWLDKQTLDELNSTKENYHGTPDFFFASTNSKAWYLNKKILIIKWTN
jgi:hypothetical protein